MYLAKTSQICSLRQHNLDVNGRKILQEHKTTYVYLDTYIYIFNLHYFQGT